MDLNMNANVISNVNVNVNLKYTILLALVLSSMLFFSTGCESNIRSTVNEQDDKIALVQKENESLKEMNDRLKEENEILKKEKTEWMEKSDSLTKGAIPTTPNQAGIDGNAELLPVYGMDGQGQKEEISFYIEVDKNLPLESKLNLIAEKLSRFRFRNLPIRLLKIKEENDKKIAVFNLEEYSKNKGITETEKLTGSPSDTWRFGFFQGSTGGNTTTVTLEKTFLQREYTGEWIDAVEFLYEGNPIMWQHVFKLEKPFYR